MLFKTTYLALIILNSFELEGGRVEYDGWVCAYVDNQKRVAFNLMSFRQSTNFERQCSWFHAVFSSDFIGIVRGDDMNWAHG